MFPNICKFDFVLPRVSPDFGETGRAGSVVSQWLKNCVDRDMRHPHKYGRALRITFSFTYLLDATAAVVGLLMFGDDVMDASRFLHLRSLLLVWASTLSLISVSWISMNGDSRLKSFENSFFAPKVRNGLLTETQSPPIS